jgi:DNA-binding CsgD family transcriptional regulator
VRRSALASTLDAMSEAMMLVGSDGRELHRNPALRRALSGEPERERVAGEMVAAARALVLPPRRIVRDRRDRIDAAAERVVTTPLERYTVRAAHLPSELLGEDGGVLVSLECPKADALDDPSDISRRHGLTRREAEVAAALARRFSNAEIAQALGISPNTALRHTERVMAKLGVHTRLDVAARLRGGDVDQGNSSGAA